MNARSGDLGEDLLINRDGLPVAKLVQVDRVMDTNERKQRLVAFQKWRREHGPTLGPNLTLKELIEEGRC